MKEFVERIVRALVDFPEEVDVREIEGPTTNILEIKVSKPDIGKLIGREGKNIDALRILVAAAGKGKGYMVEILEENRHLRERSYPQEASDQGNDQDAE